MKKSILMLLILGILGCAQVSETVKTMKDCQIDDSCNKKAHEWASFAKDLAGSAFPPIGSAAGTIALSIAWYIYGKKKKVAIA